MKKIFCVFVVFLIIVVSGCSTSASAKEITVELDGTKLSFDVEPRIIEGRTMVPLRKIFEEVGAKLKWSGEEQKVSAKRNSKELTFTVGSGEMSIYKGDTDEAGNPITETVSLDVPAQIVSGRTLVPARAISEAFGFEVSWDQENRKVTIISEDEKDDSWKENKGTINLTDLIFTGSGIEIKGNQISITKGGDYELCGTLENGNITVSTKERVKLRLNGASVTSSENPCIFFEKTDKAFITVEDGTENLLVAENSGDGAIYSKENLEIKGDGVLNITSENGHGIKASDNLKMEKGTINIIASGDGIHINDTFTLSGGNINISAVGDGVDCESIVDIIGGKINIETNATPIETAATTQQPRMFEESISVEFEKSSKGISAEWMLCVSGGEIEVNAASHAIHCADEIEISGGRFNLSSKYEKGISAHGNMTISGDTAVNITKSTEGIESKNILTINEGTLRITSSDDGINATGGNDGAMMIPGGGKGTGQKDEPQFGGERPRGGFKGGRGERPMPENMPEGMMPPPNMPEGMMPPPNMPEGMVSPENMGNRVPPQNMGDMENMPFPEFGGRGNMKDCLIINGGDIEIYAGDDCIDANGNILISGGIIKAIKDGGNFYGAFGVVDPDGSLSVKEGATLIFACGGGSERGISLSQNTITVNCDAEHTGDSITLYNASGEILCEYSPAGKYRAVLISSPYLKTGESYKINIGEETHEITVSNQNTTIGQSSAFGGGFGKGTRGFNTATEQ